MAELPGVTGLSGPQVLVGAPGWPVVGVTVAKAVVAVAIITLGFWLPKPVHALVQQTSQILEGITPAGVSALPGHL